MSRLGKYVATAGTLACLGLGTVCLAQNSKPTIQEALPDLTCTITASQNEDGTKPIKNGNGIAFNGGAMVDTWVHVKVRNRGSKKAEHFLVKRNISHNAGSVIDTQNELSLASGQIHKYQPVKIQSGLNDDSVEAVVQVDTAKSVKEKTEWNNRCTTKYNVSFVK